MIDKTKIFIILLFTIISYSFAIGLAGDSLDISVFKFRNTYFNYKLTPFKVDSLQNDSNDISPLEQQANNTNFDKIKKNGFIYRGISVGSDQDLSINSGLNLNISGKLLDNLEVEAELSDNNMPIASDGGTKQVSDIENIFIQIKHPHFFSRMGNYTLSRQNNGSFGNFEKQLIGAYLKGIVTKDKIIEAAVAVSRGEKYTNKFNGIEGINGPYLLYSKTGLTGITVISASEKVYLNGLILKKGSDYTIDYSNGEIYFSNKRIIVSDDQIFVDFEYSGDNYKKYIYNLHSDLQFGNFNFKNGYYTNFDDSKHPLSFEASKENMDIIKNAGTDSSSAVLSGESYLGENKGSYLKEFISMDSTLTDSLFYYNYVGKDNGDYAISFSKTGYGTYDKFIDSTGTVYYDTVSVGGNYSPIIMLALPKSFEAFNSFSEYKDKNLSVIAEISLSRFQENSLSVEKNNKFSGLGNEGKLSYISDEIKINQTKIGNIGFSVLRNFRNKKLRTIDRTINPKYQDEIGTNLDSLDQTTYKGSIFYNYRSLNNTSFTYENFEGSNNYQNLTSKKLGFNSFGGNSWLHNYNLTIFRRISSNNKAFSFKNDYLSTSITYKIINSIFITPEYEKDFSTTKKDSIFGEDNSNYNLKATYSNFKSLDILNSFSFLDKSISNDRDGFHKYLERYRNYFNLKYKLSSFLQNEVTWNRIYTKYFADDSTNQLFDMAKIKSEYNYYDRISGNLEYLVEKTAHSQKVRKYYEVNEGSGSYELVNGEYIPSENGNYDYYTYNSGTYFPTTKVKFSISSYINPKEKSKDTNILYWLSRIDLDLNLNIEEESKIDNPYKIMFLDFDKFQSDSTVYGIIDFNSTAYLFRDNPLGFEYNFHKYNRLSNQYLYNGEKEKFNSNKIAMINKFNTKFKLRTSFLYSTNIIYYLNSSYLSKDIETKYISQTYNFYLSNILQFGIFAKYQKDDDSKLKLNSELYELTPSASYSFFEKGVIRSDFTFGYVDTKQSYLPYQMASGFKKRVNLKWSLNGNYYITKKITADVAYKGSQEENKKAWHEVSATIKMTF